MLNQENKHLITAYSLTLAITLVLVVILINFNSWFSPNSGEAPVLTSASRGVISQNDLKLGLFNDSKFKSLGPLVTPDEFKQFENEDRSAPSTISGTVTGTVKPLIKREVRHDNPFIPF